MDVIFAGFLIWLFLAPVIAWIIVFVVRDLVPFIFTIAGYLIAWLFLSVWAILKGIGRLVAWIVVQTARIIGWLCRQGGLFLYLLLDEWWHGPRAEESEEELFEEEEQQEEDKQSAYGAALALLGLREPFAEADLKRVYWQAMKTAHTDAGGTNDAAVALNTARDLVMAVKGWR